MRIVLLGICLLFAGFASFGQYTLNGNASKNDCHCYTLTLDSLNQGGSIWNDNKISLVQSFDFKFDIFLGCTDANGADGIAFVLQPISTSVGSQGGGLGYSGVMPAVGVTIDTWQNGSATDPGPDGDPYYDHIAIQLNGDLNHKDSVAPNPINNIAGPVTALEGSDNIEDCQWHILRVQWNAVTKTLSAYVDGKLRVSTIKDFVADVFNGDPQVFWGFTGSTGGAKNLQQMCTALKPLYHFLPGQKRCVGEKITFVDSTISFAPVKKTYWDFGDNSPVDSVNLNPEHTYTTAGNYTVVQRVIGAEGCIEINTRQVLVGSIPVAAFTFNNACVSDSAVKLVSTSATGFGTINNWYWDLGDTSLSALPNPVKVYNSTGLKKIRLAVSTAEGCVSDTIEHTIRIFDKPVTDFSFTNEQCSGQEVVFTGAASVTDGTITKWSWDLDPPNAVSSATQVAVHSYAVAGLHEVRLTATSVNGCTGNTVSKTINILPAPVAAFAVSRLCLFAPVTFTDSSYTSGGDSVVARWWDLGNGSNNFNRQPITTYTNSGNIEIKLVASTANGCKSDTLTRQLYFESKPVADFGYASPVCAGVPVQFADSSMIADGTIQSWYWLFDNTNAVTERQPLIPLTAGNHTVRLVATNGAGCNSDTLSRILLVNPTPILDFTNTPVCINATALFNGIQRAVDNIIQWKWTFDDGSVSNARDTMRVYNMAGSFPVSLSGMAATGCYSDTITKNIEVYSTKAFAGNDTIAAINQPVQLNGSGGINYEWLPAAGLSSRFIANPVATINTDRTYIVRAFTDIGCSSYDTIRIKVYEGPQLYIPTAFSPNGDGLNDVLKVLPVGMKKFQYFTVFNRVGEIVFTTTDPGKGWDGTYKGKAQNTGAYVWIAAAVGFRGNLISEKGTVMLLR